MFILKEKTLFLEQNKNLKNTKTRTNKVKYSPGK